MYIISVDTTDSAKNTDSTFYTHTHNKKKRNKKINTIDATTNATIGTTFMKNVIFITFNTYIKIEKALLSSDNEILRLYRFSLQNIGLIFSSKSDIPFK